jgi:transcriptional regulator with XRE-family HTH domain
MQRRVHPLRTNREAHNLTREQLAEKIGVGAATIKRAEHGKSIGPDTRQRLCTFFGQSSEELGLTTSDDTSRQNEGKEEMSSAAPISTPSALAHYIEQQRQRLMSALAPGTTTLRVGEIIGAENLFIPPTWRSLSSPTPLQPLTDYLVHALLQGHRLLLLGDAGQGKTTILKRIFILLTEHFPHNTPSPLPIYIPLREYTHVSGNALDILWEHVREDLPLPYEAFTSLIRNKQVVFLFDGFDEIPGPVTQHAINQRAAWNIFRLPSLLSCRKSFFDFYLSMSPLQEIYSEQVELQPLQVFSDPVTHYIATFCQRHTPQTDKAQISKIIEAIQISPELQDLAQRPLLLLMILEIFTNTEDLNEKQWSITELYRQYTERWLKHEAAKPDAVLKWHEKATLLQEVAWQATVESSHAIFTLEELHTFTHSNITKYTGRTEAQLLEDLCFRTLLGVAEDSNYAFLHKSFQEYYAARHVFACMRRRNALDAIEQVLRASLPFDIATYLKKMLRESEPHEKSLIATNLINIYRRNQQQSQTAVTIRQQATYYLSNLRTDTAAHFLESIYQQESNKWVQRGIMLGLALYAGKAEMLEQYLQIIREDTQAATINTIYHLIYYGDQAGNLEALDAPEQTITHSEKTVAALFRHLQNKRYQNGWALDLFTLSTLLELQGPSILSTHTWHLPFLKQFLETNHPDHRASLLQEKKRLQQLIEGGSIEQQR